MSDYMFKNYSLVRGYSVEALDRVLKDKGRIICRDSKLSRAVVISFMENEEDLAQGLDINPSESFKDKIKIEMIKKILES